VHYAERFLADFVEGCLACTLPETAGAVGKFYVRKGCAARSIFSQ
jgi:hypothetical protein